MIKHGGGRIMLWWDKATGQTERKMNPHKYREILEEGSFLAVSKYFSKLNAEKKDK